ncbi:hypothetical protein EOPP23_07930 [Endozoicomonas sp. OPT23]|uniref:hypothetical protein n=1 Tax=Endozoicomonas sp. OPT23 TaxID=2072845 RepID=UPI00129BEDEC|nr:hypothetical protein [Endozoicomonas sp. OPT23]MRI32912.1 hypothetical protein [Endozoicomonas sp. OPT23]
MSESRNSRKKKLPSSWSDEAKAVKAVQMAFDLEADLQKEIRREALEMDLTPSDRVRQLLGLPIRERPRRLRLSVSLTDEEIKVLAQHYGIDENDRVAIKRKAAEYLADYTRSKQLEQG